MGEVEEEVEGVAEAIVAGAVSVSKMLKLSKAAKIFVINNLTISPFPINPGH